MQNEAIYRDGVQEILTAYKARLERVASRARALDGAARKRLLPALVRELESAETALSRFPSTREELDAAEKVLDEYEAQVDLALSVLAGLAERASTRRWNLRHTVIAIACLGVAAATLVGGGIYADRQSKVRRDNAYYAGCRQRPECEARGLCAAPPIDRRGAVRACWAASDDDCWYSAECRSLGRCTADNGVCRAGSEQGCRNTEGCSERGACSPQDGECRVVRDEDCGRSSPCYERGRCRAIGRMCEVRRSEDCARSKRCRENGECSAEGGACRAASDADCARSSGCKEQGRCVAHQGTCAVSDEGCRPTDACKRLGECSAVGASCGPRRPEDCAHSEACKEAGLCVPSGGPKPVCVASAAGCRASAGCREAGLCTFTGAECVVESAADCARSSICAKYGHCTLRKMGTMTICGPGEGPIEGSIR